MKSRFSFVRIPAYTLLAAMVVLAVYYYFHISNRERALISRAFATLTALGGDLREKLESCDEAADNYCGPDQIRCRTAEDGQRLRHYLHHRVQDVVAGDLPVGVVRRTYDLKPAAITIGVKTDRFLGRLAGQETLDAIALADSSGKIIRHWMLSEGGPSDVDALARVLDMEKAQRGKVESDSLLEGRIAGQSHHFLLHRFTVPAPFFRGGSGDMACKPSDVTDARNCVVAKTPVQYLTPRQPPGKDEAGEQTYILFGFVSSSGLRARTTQIPYSVSLWLIFFVLCVFASMPLLQTQFMNARERFSRANLMGLALGSVFIAVLVSCCFLTVHHFFLVERGRTDAYLTTLAGEIEENLAAEVRAIHEQLALLTMDYRTNSAPSGCPAERTNLLACDPPERYPFFGTAVWLDEKGCQRAKWTTLRETTPFVNVADRAYFSAIPAGAWSLRDHAGAPFYLQMLRSRNTSANLAVVSTAPPGGGIACPLFRLTVATMVGQLLSVMDPVLPAGFGFAILDEKGGVVFHSEP
ncbi:MAG: hypothetical protein ACRD44_12485, partial [Bryobacteraceae bacterium]